jgi:hypothetical protein
LLKKMNRWVRLKDSAPVCGCGHRNDHRRCARQGISQGKWLRAQLGNGAQPGIATSPRSSAMPRAIKGVTFAARYDRNSPAKPPSRVCPPPRA